MLSNAEIAATISCHVWHLSTAVTRNLINKMVIHYSLFLLDMAVVLDNGPQYASSLFKEFARQCGLQHNTSSLPYYKEVAIEVRRSLLSSIVLQYYTTQNWL